MTKTFPIDFVRQFIEQSLHEEHNKYPTKYFGGANQVNLFSFYEQLEKDDEVNRYTEMYRDLSNQQNRTGLIMNGTIIAPENPTITNINQCLIVPMTFTCNFRVKLADRDMALETINHLIELYKGRKIDIAELNTGKLFKVGTIANNSNGSPIVTDGDCLGVINNADVVNKLTALSSQGITYSASPLGVKYFYGTSSKIETWVWDTTDLVYKKITNGSAYPNIILPPDHTSFTRYQLSISFEALRCDTPRTLNSEEYCVISFGGSATLSTYNVMLGNQLTKVGIKRLEVKASTDITVNSSIAWLEPLEMPNNNSANTQMNQLVSNRFLNNTHTDSISITINYSFILQNKPLLIQWFLYARYGIQADGSETYPYTTYVSPNMIYAVSEIWSAWGEVDIHTYKAKIVESIEIDNSESDVLTISVPFQLQGDNN